MSLCFGDWGVSRKLSNHGTVFAPCLPCPANLQLLRKFVFALPTSCQSCSLIAILRVGVGMGMGAGVGVGMGVGVGVGLWAWAWVWVWVWVWVYRASHPQRDGDQVRSPERQGLGSRLRRGC